MGIRLWLATHAGPYPRWRKRYAGLGYGNEDALMHIYGNVMEMRPEWSGNEDGLATAAAGLYWQAVANGERCEKCPPSPPQYV